MNSRFYFMPVVILSAISTRSQMLRGQSPAGTEGALPPIATGVASDSAAPGKTFFTRRDAVIAGSALVGSAVLSAFDVRIARWTQRPRIQGGTSRQDFVHNLTWVNERPLTAAAVSTYAIGRLAHSSGMADVGLHMTEALVLTTAASELIRVPLGRSRPRVSQDDQYNFHFGGGLKHFDERAYPSIHAAVAFATASSLVTEMRERHAAATWYVAPLLYAGAMVPGLTRMYLNQHWASDVLAGAALGQLLGSKVVHYAHTHRRSKLDRALLGALLVPNGHGGTLVGLSFD